MIRFTCFFILVNNAVDSLFPKILIVMYMLGVESSTFLKYNSYAQ